MVLHRQTCFLGARSQTWCGRRVAPGRASPNPRRVTCKACRAAAARLDFGRWRAVRRLRTTERRLAAIARRHAAIMAEADADRRARR